MDAFSLDDNKKKILGMLPGQPVNSLGEPVQGVIDANQQQDYVLAPWANQQQPQQQESGYLDAAIRGAKAQAAGALGGQADFVSGVLGTNGEVGDALQGVMQRNNRKRNYTFDDITKSFGNAWQYATDPEGLAYDVGGGFGSSGVLGMEGLAIASALPASVTAGIGSGIAAAAARVGIPWLGKVMNTPAGKALIGNVLKTPLEGASEGGNVYREMTHDEYGNPIANSDKDAARKAMYTDAAMNSALLIFTNTLESMGLGSLIAGAGGKNVFARTLKGAVGDFMQNGFEEGAQQGISQYSQGKGTLGQILNPAQWSEEQKTEALIGGITGLGQGAVMTGGGTLANKMLGNNAETEEVVKQEQPSEPVQAQQTPETEQQELGSNDLVNKVRALKGQIPFYADDGTNCMRTMGIALAGTPYEGQINVDQAIATATELGQLMDPETYTPRPGDLAVNEDGEHIVMVTENGGTIQNGASQNGVYESDASAAEMSSNGKVKYYIRTSDYSNGGGEVVANNLEYTDELNDFLSDTRDMNIFDSEEQARERQDAIVKEQAELMGEEDDELQRLQETVEQYKRATQGQANNVARTRSRQTPSGYIAGLSDDELVKLANNMKGKNVSKSTAQAVRLELARRIDSFANKTNEQKKQATQTADDLLLENQRELAKDKREDTLEQRLSKAREEVSRKTANDFAVDRALDALEAENNAQMRANRRTDFATTPFMPSTYDTNPRGTAGFRNLAEAEREATGRVNTATLSPEELARTQDIADNTRGKLKVRDMISRVREERAAKKQQALDYEWMMAEHEQNMKGYANADEVRNNPAPNVQKAAQSRAMQDVTRRAMAGDHGAQRTFDRMGKAAKAFMMQREIDRLTNENDFQSQLASTPDRATEPFMPAAYEKLRKEGRGGEYEALQERARRKREGEDGNGVIPTKLPEGYVMKNGKSLKDADKNDFIANDKGEIDLWHFDKLKEQTNGKLDNYAVRMQAGDKGYGYKHLVFRHIDEIRGEGFENAFEYIDYIMKNYNQVYDQSDSKYAQRYAFYVKDDKKGFMPVDLEIKKDGDNYYTIVTVMPHKAKIKGTLLYDGSARPSTTTTNGPLSVTSANKGGDTVTIGNAKANVPSVDNIISQTEQIDNESKGEEVAKEVQNNKNESENKQPQVNETRESNNENSEPEQVESKQGQANEGGENQVDLNDKDSIIQYLEKLENEDLPIIEIDADTLRQTNHMTPKEMLEKAVEYVKGQLGKTLVDPLGENIYFEPGSTENVETYALHMIAGMDKPVEASRRARLLGLLVADKTVQNPLAIIHQSPRNENNSSVPVTGQARKVYLALYKGKNTFSNSLIVGVEEGQEGRIVTSMVVADKNGNKKSALKALKNAIKDAVDVVYIWEGQSGHSRPSPDQTNSTVNANLIGSGNSILSQETEKSNNAQKQESAEKGIKNNIAEPTNEQNQTDLTNDTFDKKAIDEYRDNQNSEQPQGEYKYYMNERGATPGAVPEGFTRFDEDDKGGKYGAIYYAKPLSKNEIAAYELTPDSNNAKQESIQDFGNKIGGARKDRVYLDDPLKPKGEKRKAKVDTDKDLPEWRKTFDIKKDALAGGTGKPYRVQFKPRAGGKIPWNYRVLMSTTFETEHEAELAIKAAVYTQNFTIGQNGTPDNPNFAIEKRIGTDSNRKYFAVKDGFKTREEAQEYAVRHIDEILATKTYYGEADLATPLIKSWQDARTGNAKDRLKGKNATAQMFAEDFGFYGVQFGNWNNQQERQEVMNAAYEGLHDLAEALGLPPKIISLNGNLGLAFGARGQGLSGARAHFEPMHLVINLTKMKGAGALAHEWMHAVDQFLLIKGGIITLNRDAEGKLLDKNALSKASELGFTFGRAKLNKELSDSFKNLMNSMLYKEETFTKDQNLIDKRINNNKEALDQELNRVRKYVAEERKYGSRKAPATAEQLKEFDEIATRIAQSEEEPKYDFGLERYTTPDIEALGALVKKITGRGFAKNNDTAATLVQRIRMGRVYAREKQNALEQSQGVRQVPTDYKAANMSIDSGRATDYWTKPTEMLSRAFSAFVEDELKDKGYTSDFMSYGSDNRLYLFGKPFPEGKERERINENFKAFFKEVAKEVERNQKESDEIKFSLKAEEWGPKEEYPTGERTYGEVLEEIVQAFPNAKVETQNGMMVFSLPNGSKFQVSVKKNIILNAKQKKKALASHGVEEGQVQGYWRRLTTNGIERMLAVSKNSERGTAFHEAMHAAIDLALTEKERNALTNYYNKLAEEEGRDTEEVIADAYRDWALKRQKGQGTVFGKLWRKIKDFCTKIKAFFDKGAEVQSIFQDVESGKVYERKIDQAAVRKGKKLLAQIAYHGSPYKFDDFTLEHIGEGQGAQAHGWGLYFAQDKSVAETYKNVKKSDNATLYTVDVPENDVLLDEQLPLNQQPKEVQKAVKSLIEDAKKFHYETNDEGDYELYQDKKYLGTYWYSGDMRNDIAKLGGKVAFNHLASINENSTGKQIYEALGFDTGTDKDASLLLNEYGVKGIAYNGTQDGKCVVVFDDKAIKVLEKLDKKAENTQTSNRADRKIQGLDYTVGEAEELLKEDVAAKLQEIADDYGIEISMVDAKLHGSRVRQTARTDSDLDLVVEYKGDIREDELFNALNEEPITLDGITVDINPITASDTGTLESYMEKDKEYDRQHGRDDIKYSVSKEQPRTVTRQEVQKAVENIVPLKVEKDYRSDAYKMYNRKANVGFVHAQGSINELNGIIGMYIDTQKKLSDNAELRDELIKNAWDYQQDQKKARKFAETEITEQVKEGAAYFGRLYAIDKDQAKAMFPKYYAAFERALNTDKALKAKVDSYLGTAEAFYKQTPEGRAKAGLTQLEKEPTTWKEKAKNYAKQAYVDWFDDKDVLRRVEREIETITGSKIKTDDSAYMQARVSNSSAASRVDMVVNGAKTKWGKTATKNSPERKAWYKALNNVYHGAWKHDVCYQDIVDKVTTVNADYLKKGNFKDGMEALGSYLLANRFLEIWETKPNYKASMSKETAEKVVANAPKAIKEAADMYYKFDDNLIAVMNKEGMLSNEGLEGMRKYTRYCPLFRDFADEAAFDKFMSSMSSPNSYINLSNGIKALTEEGSDRTVLDDPTKSMLRMTASILGKVEKNKVGQKFVALSERSNVGQFVIPAIDPKTGKQLDTSNPQFSRFTVWENGEKKAYVTLPEVYDVLENTTHASAYAALLDNMIARGASSALRKGATISMGFMIRNFIRDTIGATINSKNGFIPLKDSFRGMNLLLNDAEFRNQYLASGANMAGYFKQDAESLDKMLNEMAGNGWWQKSSMLDKLHMMWEHYEQIGELIEQGTRAGEFKKALEKNKSLLEAAIDAKEVTLDFSRAGAKGRQFNRVIPFFNAILQGGDKMVRTAVDNPQKTMAMCASLSLATMLLWAINHDDDWYKELDNESKYSNWHFHVGDKHIKIPKPQEFGMLSCASVEAVLEQMFEKNPKAMNDWAYQFVDNMIPSFIPALYRPILEVCANYDYHFHSAVVGKKYQNLAPEAQINSNTSEFAKLAGKMAGYSPIKIDHIIRGYFGGAGAFVARIPNKIIADGKQPAKYWNEMPVINEFVENDFAHSKSVNNFYELMDAANKQHTTYGKKGQPSADVVNIRKYGTIISGLRKDIQKITANTVISPERKRQLIDNKTQRINQVARRAVEKYGDKYL